MCCSFFQIFFILEKVDNRVCIQKTIDTTFCIIFYDLVSMLKIQIEIELFRTLTILNSSQSSLR